MDLVDNNNKIYKKLLYKKKSNKKPLLHQKKTKKFSESISKHTKRKYIKPIKNENEKEKEKEKEKENEFEQSGGESLRSLYKAANKIFHKIEKRTKEMDSITQGYIIYDDMLKKLLNDRTEAVNYLMDRHQQLILFEKQEAYIEAMKKKNPPKGDVDFYQTQLEIIKYQKTKVSQFIEEYEERKKGIDKEIDQIRTQINKKKKVKLNATLQKKFDLAIDNFVKFGEKFQKIKIELDNDELFKKQTDKSHISKEALSRANAFYNTFHKLKSQINSHKNILQTAYLKKEKYLEVYNSIFEDQANYISVNQQFEEQKENYKKISPILDKIFGFYIPNVVSRKLPGLDDASSKIDELILQFKIAGGAIEKQVVPVIDFCNTYIKQVKDVQNGIIGEMKKINSEMFKISPTPQGAELGKKTDELIKATNECHPYLTDVIQIMERVLTLQENTKLSGGGSVNYYKQNGGDPTSEQIYNLMSEFYKKLKSNQIIFANVGEIKDIGPDAPKYDVAAASKPLPPMPNRDYPPESTLLRAKSSAKAAAVAAAEVPAETAGENIVYDPGTLVGLEFRRDMSGKPTSSASYNMAAPSSPITSSPPPPPLPLSLPPSSLSRKSTQRLSGLIGGPKSTPSLPPPSHQPSPPPQQMVTPAVAQSSLSPQSTKRLSGLLRSAEDRGSAPLPPAPSSTRINRYSNVIQGEPELVFVKSENKTDEEILIRSIIENNFNVNRVNLAYIDEILDNNTTVAIIFSNYIAEVGYADILQLLLKIEINIKKYLLSIGVIINIDTNDWLEKLIKKNRLTQYGGDIKKTKKKLLLSENKNKSHNNHLYKKIKTKNSKVLRVKNKHHGGSIDIDEQIIGPLNELNAKILDKYKSISTENISTDDLFVLNIIYYSISKLYSITRKSIVDRQIKLAIKGSLDTIESIFHKFDLTPSFSINDSLSATSVSTKTPSLISTPPSTESPLKPQPKGLTITATPLGPQNEEEEEDNEYVGLVVLNDYNEMVQKILSSDSVSKLSLLPNQSSSLIQGVQGIAQQGTFQTSTTTPVNIEDANMIEIINNIKQLIKNNFPSVIQSTKIAKKDLETQVDEFKKLGGLFKEMDKIQKSVSEISGKIPKLEIQKADVYIMKEEKVKKYEPTLSEVLARPITSQVQKAMEKKVAELKPEIFSNTFEAMASSTPTNYLAGLPQFALSSIGIATPQTQQTPQKLTSLVPTKQDISGFGSLPGISGMISFPGINGQPFQIKPTRKLNPSVTKDKLLLEQEAELYQFIILYSQEEFNNFMNKNKGFIQEHPMAAYYLASPMGVKWLTSPDNNFLSSKDGIKILPDIIKILDDPRVSGPNGYGQVYIEKLRTLSTEGIQEKAKKEAFAELAVAEKTHQLAQMKGIEALQKK